MPIDYRKYSPDFKQISRRIRFERAGNRCEWCGIANYTVIEYVDECQESTKPFSIVKEARDYAKKMNSQSIRVGNKGIWFSVVILTVAHLDHNTANDDEGNLKALCQRCHLGHDRRDNAEKRRYGPTGRHYNQIRLPL
jgi:hypothetical protein